MCLTVFGSNDGDRLFPLHQFQDTGSIYPESCKIEIDGKQIIMFHKNDVIADLARNNQYLLIIHGHTHKVNYYHVDNTTKRYLKDKSLIIIGQSLGKGRLYLLNFSIGTT